MHNLWVEKYRPSTLNGYVFRDEAQKRQIETWVKEGTIPHLLMSGPAGVGKCLGPDTEITVKFDVQTLTLDQRIRLDRLLANRA